MKRVLFIVLLVTIFCGCKKEQRQVVFYSEVHSTERIRQAELKIIEDFYKNGGRTLLLERGFCRGELFNHWADTGNEESLRLALSPRGINYKELENDINFYKKILDLCPELRFYGVDLEHGYLYFKDYFMTNVYDNLSEEEKTLSKESIEQMNAIENVDYNDVYKNKDNYENNEYIENYREEKMAENAINVIKDKKEKIIGFFGRAHLIKLEDSNSMICIIQKQLPWVKDEDLVGQMEIDPGENYKLRVYGKDINAKFIVTDYGNRQSHGSISSMETYRIENTDDFKDNKVISDPFSYYITFKIKPNEYYLIKYNIQGGMYYYKMFRVSDKYIDRSGNPMIEEIEI